MNRGFWLLAGVLSAMPALGQKPTDPRAAAGCGPVAEKFSVSVDKARRQVVNPEAGKSLVYVIV